MQFAQDAGELQADDDKDKSVEKEHDRVPKGEHLQTKAGPDDER